MNRPSANAESPLPAVFATGASIGQPKSNPTCKGLAEGAISPADVLPILKSFLHRNALRRKAVWSAVGVPMRGWKGRSLTESDRPRRPPRKCVPSAGEVRTRPASSEKRHMRSLISAGFPGTCLWYTRDICALEGRTRCVPAYLAHQLAEERRLGSALFRGASTSYQGAPRDKLETCERLRPDGGTERCYGLAQEDWQEIFMGRVYGEQKVAYNDSVRRYPASKTSSAVIVAAHCRQNDVMWSVRAGA